MYFDYEDTTTNIDPTVWHDQYGRAFKATDQDTLQNIQKTIFATT